MALLKRFLYFALIVCAQQAMALNQSLIVKQIDQKFRSSSYDIEADVLMNQSFPKIGPELLQQLAALTPADVVKGFVNCPECKANKAVVENIIKIQLVAKTCLSLCMKQETLSVDISKKYRALNPVALLASFPEASADTKKDGEFDYTEYELAMKVKTSPLNNDLYNFKQAGGYFAEGMHLSHRSTFRLFSRGHDQRNYIMSLGQDQVLDLLQNLRFTDAQVAALQKNPEFNKIPAAYFEYLKDFRFTGTVRGVAPGTIVFRDEPILEITGNTVEVTIIETLIIPWINKMSNFASNASRIVEVSGGRILLEGGTRRGADGFFSSIAALVAGFHGTSNVEVARLTGEKVGGTEAHQWIGHWVDEVLGHSVYKEYFPTATLLVDTYDILEGVRRAVRASGPHFKGIRLDSAIPGLSEDSVEAERLTAIKVRDLLKSLGYNPESYTITYSNKLKDSTLAKHTNAKSPFQVALIGTQVASPDTQHLNMVYKAVQMERVKSAVKDVYYAIKLAAGKVLQPGATQLYRRYDSRGIIAEDLLAMEGEQIDQSKGFIPLMKALMENGQRMLARESVAEQKKRALKERESLPPELRALEPAKTKFAYTQSPGAQAVQEDAKNQALNKNKPAQVGVFIMSADPMHDMHEQMIRRATELYQFDKIFIVLTGDERVHKGKPLFDARERLAMAKRRFPDAKLGKAEIVFWNSEIDGTTKYTIDTLEAIRSSSAQARQADIRVVVGNDVFKTLSTWKEAERLAHEFSWGVVVRQGGESDFMSGNEHLFTDFKKRNTTYFGKKTTVENIDLRLEAMQSTDFRNKVQSARYLFHEVDASAKQSSAATRENIAILKWLSKNNSQIKSTAFADESSGAEHGSRISEVVIFDEAHSLEIKEQAQAAFNVEAHADKILDPDIELLMKNNGAKAHSLWTNSYADKVFNRINPRMIFVFGVTDFGVREFVLGAKKRGFDVVVVTDAIISSSAEQMQNELTEMQKVGVRLAKTAEVAQFFQVNTTQALIEAKKQLEEIKRKNSIGSCKKLYGE